MKSDPPWALPPRIPRTGHRVLQRIGLGSMHLLGWKIEGAFPNLDRFVVIFAPHTSNWDFFILLAAKWSLGIDVRWLAKDGIFFPPLGWLLRKLGGIAVERTGSHNVVDRSIEEFAARTPMVLVLAPEGTRKKMPAWKSGFWHIAQGAGVPIVCVGLDFGRRVVRLGPEFDAAGMDAITGIPKLRALFADVVARHPERVT